MRAIRAIRAYGAVGALRTDEEFAAEIERHYRDTHSDGYADEHLSEIVGMERRYEEWLDDSHERTHSG